MSVKSLITAACFAVVPAVFAGGGEKCSSDAQSCINYMAEKFADKGWLGVELDHDDSGTLVVVSVIEGSPAEAAGIHVGEGLVALNGVRFDADEAVKREAYKQLKPGAQVTYTLSTATGDRDIKVTLGKMPEDVKAKWIGLHMLDQHTEVAAVN